MTGKSSAGAGAQSRFSAACQEGSGMKSIRRVQQGPVVKLIAADSGLPRLAEIYLKRAMQYGVEKDRKFALVAAMA